MLYKEEMSDHLFDADYPDQEVPGPEGNGQRVLPEVPVERRPVFLSTRSIIIERDFDLFA